MQCDDVVVVVLLSELLLFFFALKPTQVFAFCTRAKETEIIWFDLLGLKIQITSREMCFFFTLSRSHLGGNFTYILKRNETTNKYKYYSNNF